MIFVIIVISALCVAYANGANDNFKGVATLFGSGTTDFKRALWWATGTTMLGSMAAMLLAGNLIKSFGGKGLIDDAIAILPEFAAAVALGAGLTVLIATRVGMPVSTTHSLIGALKGVGLSAGSKLNIANIVTGIIVIGASRFGLPVSTTHVSCGSLFGLGSVTGGARRKTIITILLSWVATLPIAAIIGAGFDCLLGK